jgi:hypothetical protein
MHWVGARFLNRTKSGVLFFIYLLCIESAAYVLNSYTQLKRLICDQIVVRTILRIPL